ncbi:6-pyruvoyl trahydropterin synthase family protein (plasmid) [Streptosporangium sandarakinum]|uniref:6-pyruvoyl trahydropterin synthase family protein n=1 Tax=Streptosporangium sandarakinum TaxID=1260955 RepID=UPI003D92F81F
MFTATLRHSFDAAHRLPHLGGKCANLHGHTWKADITFGAGYLNNDSTIVEFGRFKKLMRAWIDTHLDHATLLGADDPLLEPLRAERCRVYVFGADFPEQPWPTVEAVAQLLAHHAHTWLRQAADRVDAAVLRVDVAETPTNTASWYATTYRPGAFL